MSGFKNVSGVPLEVVVGGVSYRAAVGASIAVPDVFDYQLADQPVWQSAKSKPEPAPAPVEGEK